MSIPVGYGYLFGASLYLIPWIIFFLLRKDLRREMIAMSIIAAGLGIVAEGIWYTQDWWSPQTITGTRIGIEDLILGFSSGGIAAVVYEVFFRKFHGRRLEPASWRHLATPIVIFFLISSAGFFLFDLHSYSANMIGLGAAVLSVYLHRPDLIPDSLATAVIFALLTVPLYLILFAVYPDFKESYWHWERISGVEWIGIPYEDLVWWAGIGALGGPLYEFWQGFGEESRG